jgi:hypothetical protein
MIFVNRFEVQASLTGQLFRELNEGFLQGSFFRLGTARVTEEALGEYRGQLETAGCGGILPPPPFGTKKKEAEYFQDVGSIPIKTIPINRRQKIKTLGSRLRQKRGAPPRELNQRRQAQFLTDRLRAPEKFATGWRATEKMVVVYLHSGGTNRAGVKRKKERAAAHGGW